MRGKVALAKDLIPIKGEKVRSNTLGSRSFKVDLASNDAKYNMQETKVGVGISVPYR